MADPQARSPRHMPAVPTEVRQRLAAKGSRFARAARDPQWNTDEASQARAQLAKQATQARKELLARRLATARQAQAPLLPARKRVRIPSQRGRWAAWLLTPLTVLLVLALLGSAPPVSSQTRNTRNAPSKQSIQEMQRLVEVAREAGLTDEQIRQITIEDDFGNVINAFDYLQTVERAQQTELARKRDEQTRVYLTPQDVFKELRARERADLDILRERLPYDRERYR